jgi:hypothetical protein
MSEETPDDRPAVEYALTEDDLMAFANVGGQTFLMRFDVGTLRVFAFLAVIVIVPLLGFASGSAEWWEEPGFRHRAVGVVGIFLIALFVFEKPLLNHLLRRRIRAGRFAGLMERRRLELTPAGIRSVTRVSDDTASWDHISRIVVSAAGLHLIYGARRGFLVPRHAFAKPTDFAAFADAARRLKRDRAASNAPAAG